VTDLEDSHTYLHDFFVLTRKIAILDRIIPELFFFCDFFYLERATCAAFFGANSILFANRALM